MTQSSNKKEARAPASNAKRPPRKKFQKVTPARPGYATYWQSVQLGSGQVLKPGLYWHGVNDNTEIDTYICSPLEVVAITSDNRGENYGRLLRFLPLRGEPREWAAPMEMLAGDGGELRAELLRMGVTIPQKQRQALTDYLMNLVPKRHALAATATGWYSPDLFVMPGGIIGAGDVVFQSAEAGSAEYTASGTAEGWRNNVARLCAGNPVLMMAVCAALAGSLLWLLDVDSGGFHFVGDSSSGKSVAALVACSVWGEPRSFKRNWNATSTGLEGLATMRNDTALILDEIGEAPAKDIGGLIYQLGNGTGRQRGKVTGMARPVNVWRTIIVSTGEMTVGKHMESGGQRIKAGQEMRLLDIPVQRRYGALDFLHNMELPHNPDNDAERRGAGRRFAETLRTSAGEHYGHAGVEFVRWLVSSRQEDESNIPENASPQTMSMNDMFALLREQFPTSTGQEARAAARFTLCAMAGEMAITAGVLPWRQGEALSAVKAMFEAWAEYRGKGQSEDVKILRAVMDFIARHASRFESGGANAEPVNNRAGWWKHDGNGGRLYLFLQEALCEAAGGYDLRRIAASLDAAGVIAERDNDGKRRFTKRISVNGEKHRIYAISQDALICAIDA